VIQIVHTLHRVMIHLEYMLFLCTEIHAIYMFCIYLRYSSKCAFRPCEIY